MLDFRLHKYRDFKSFLDDYFNEEISKDELLEILEALRDRYDRQHADLLEPLESDPVFYRDNQEWIDKLREATRCFEEARDAIEDAIIDDNDDIEEALETYREGNLLLNEVTADLDGFLEDHTVIGKM